tara:strand:+ start:4293 stop:4676 length:384 start_codon:yes stop_codon:yes gene_type:complete
MIGLTPKLPYSYNSGFPGGRTLINTYGSLVSQNLKNLLLTIPGERMMDPNFGVGLKRFLFEPQESSTYGNIISRINSQVSFYMPFIEIEQVDIAESNDFANMINVSILYKILPLDSIDELEITFPNN